MSKCSLLLDADVTIYFYEMDYWRKIIPQYNVHIGSIVVDEVKYYLNSSKQKIPINLSQQIKDNKITGLSATPEEMAAVLEELKKPKYDGLHEGELECIAIMQKCGASDMFMCSIDRLANLAMAYLKIDNVISVEEVLLKCSLMKRRQQIINKLSKRRLKGIITEGKLQAIQFENS